MSADLADQQREILRHETQFHARQEALNRQPPRSCVAPLAQAYLTSVSRRTSTLPAREHVDEVAPR
jgi:hypothetical protein